MDSNVSFVRNDKSATDNHSWLLLNNDCRLLDNNLLNRRLINWLLSNNNLRLLLYHSNACAWPMSKG